LVERENKEKKKRRKGRSSLNTPRRGKKKKKRTKVFVISSDKKNHSSGEERGEAEKNSAFLFKSGKKTGQRWITHLGEKGKKESLALIRKEGGGRKGGGKRDCSIDRHQGEGKTPRGCFPRFV